MDSGRVHFAVVIGYLFKQVKLPEALLSVTRGFSTGSSIAASNLNYKDDQLTWFPDLGVD